MLTLKLKDLRKRKKLTQYQLADIMGVSQATVTYWENGKREPDLATVVKLADILGASTDELLGRTTLPVIVKKEAPPPISEGEIEIVIKPDEPIPSPDSLEQMIVRLIRREMEKERNKK